MKLEIKKNDEKTIFAKFANEELEISETSENWNTEGINKFLIKLASKTPSGEKIEIIFDDKEENKIYKHIVDLFNEFAKEYNLLNSQ